MCNFDEKTRKGLKNVIRGFGASYAGKSKEANAGWEYLNPSLVASQAVPASRLARQGPSH